MSEPQLIDVEDEDIPVLIPRVAVGGGVVIGPNPNLDIDDTVVTMELLVNLFDDEGEPFPAVQPIIMELHTYTMLVLNAEQNTPVPEEDN